MDLACESVGLGAWRATSSRGGVSCDDDCSFRLSFRQVRLDAALVYHRGQTERCLQVGVFSESNRSFSSSKRRGTNTPRPLGRGVRSGGLTPLCAMGCARPIQFKFNSSREEPSRGGKTKEEGSGTWIRHGKASGLGPAAARFQEVLRVPGIVESLSMDVGFQVFGVDAQGMSKPDSSELASPNQHVYVRTAYMQQLSDFMDVEQACRHMVVPRTCRPSDERKGLDGGA